MILDTCVLIDIMRRDTRALEKLKEMTEHGEDILITSLSVFELYSGLMRSTRYEQELAKIKNVLDGQVHIPFSTDIAIKAGQIDGSLITSGKMGDVVDVMIAGMAIHLEEPILTRNIKDFKKIDGLLVETY